MIENHNLFNLEQKSFEDGIKNDFSLEISNSEKVIKGYSSQVYKANLNNEKVFIRINKDPRVFEVEQLGYKIFEEKHIPVPKIIAYKENPKSIGYPTMIMSSAVGSYLKELDISLEERDIIYEHVGEILRKINETKLTGYGQLKVKDNELVGQFKTWKEYTDFQNEHNLSALNFCLENKFITDKEYKKIKEIYKEIETLDFGKASLIHRDMHGNHFFVKGTDISGVIDLGSLTASDPRYDIATALVFQNERNQESFKKGYGQLAYDPMINKYLITIVIRKIQFRSKDDIKGNVNALLPVLKNALEKI